MSSLASEAAETGEMRRLSLCVTADNDIIEQPRWLLISLSHASF